MRRPIVAGNWKMHGAAALVDRFAAALRGGVPAEVDVVLIPPALYAAHVVQAIGPVGVACGVQNVHAASEGAFTGEISAEMAADIGATFVLVGHSERRALFHESDALVAEKCAAVRRAGLTPILCVGETLPQRRQGHAEEVVLGQLASVLDVLGTAVLESLVLAYEPVWAIGTGETATPEQAQAMHAALRAFVAERSTEAAPRVRILYGGSVKPENAATLFAQPDIDGGLVGGASLDPAGFLGICNAAGN